MSNTETDGIRVIIKATYWPERSAPDNNQWAFTYAVTIKNEGSKTATLRARHWVITDANGRVEEVRGEGVVGKQPKLEPGDSFEYTSWAMLRTPFGTMRGEYQMERADGSKFEARIAEFVLTQPNALN
ncbi:MAG TPA: Co2+/Mg2+ efflux protein ApaG [Archangium sp.]